MSNQGGESYTVVSSGVEFSHSRKNVIVSNLRQLQRLRFIDKDQLLHLFCYIAKMFNITNHSKII